VEGQLLNGRMRVMDVAKIVHVYAEVMAWPLVALIAIVSYREVIRSLFPGAKVILRIFGSSIEISVPEIERSVTESLGEDELTDDQKKFLKQLYKDRMRFDDRGLDLKQISIARPLRNAGIIKHYPHDKFLAEAKEIELTTLGRLLVEAIRKEKEK
jgi:hypothetical protein